MGFVPLLPRVIISTYSFAQKKIISLCVGETFLCVIDLGIVYGSIGRSYGLPASVAAELVKGLAVFSIWHSCLGNKHALYTNNL